MDYETCQRCGEVGEDRRTLWMACFYAMDELPVPFEKVDLFCADPKDVVERKLAERYSITSFPNGYDQPGVTEHRTVDTSHYRVAADVEKRGFFTLRVCKACRADWMAAIEQWFKEPLRRQRCGSGIFVRRLGDTVEVTEQEFQEMRHD